MSNRQIKPFSRSFDYIPLRVKSQTGYDVEFEGRGTKLDILAGGSAFIFGYGNTEIIDHISQKSQKISRAQILLNHISNDVEEVSNLICTMSRLPKISWGLSGTDAVENAINMAFKYWETARGRRPKRKIVTFSPVWHGSSFLCQRLSGFREKSGDWFEVLDAPAWKRLEDRCSAEQTVIENLKALLEKQHDDIAAIMFDPAPWVSGSKEFSNGWWTSIRELCNKYDILMIVDDIAMCWGKTKAWFSHIKQNVMPDIVTIGKAISGGYAPMSAAICSFKVYRGIEKTEMYDYSHTLHPFVGGIYAVQKTAEIIQRDNLIEKASVIEDRLREIGDALMADGLIEYYRTVGLFFSLDLLRQQPALLENGLTGRLHNGKMLNICAPLIADDSYYTRLNDSIRSFINGKKV